MENHEIREREMPAAAFGPLPDDLPARNWGWFALRGLLAIMLGVAALLMPVAALFAFALVFAAFSFADGVLTLVSGIRGARHKDQRWGMLIVSGLLGMLVGLLFFLFPMLGTMAYALLAVLIAAGWAITTGALEISAAIRLRRRIENEWLLGLAGALSLLLGVVLVILLLWRPAPTLVSVGWAIGVYALMAGVALLVLAFRLRAHASEHSHNLRQ